MKTEWHSYSVFTNLFIATFLLVSASMVFGERLNYVLPETNAVGRQIQLPHITTAQAAQAIPRTGSLEKSTTAFLEEKRAAFISSGQKFVDVDLGEMKLRLYDGGAVVDEFAILTKGRSGSWWETPIGLYEIQSRETDHFSSFGLVHQPWSLAFHGNFFIHGWPYYPDGTPVASTFSGGCVRLSTEDAERLFHQVKTGVPVLAHEALKVQKEISYEKNTQPLPPISARAFLAADLDSGYVFAEKDGAASIPIASITKLMTAVVALEQANLDHMTTVPGDAIVYTSKPRFAQGERIEAYELIYPLLTESSNEAALTLSNYFGHTRFVSLMNQMASSLGMTDTHFEDAAGRMDGNVSSAEDLVILARYILEYRKQIFDISAHDFGGNSFYGKTRFTDLSNFNLFADDETFIGGKTGKTTIAKETMLAIFEREINGEKRRIILVVLGSENNKNDIEALLSYSEHAFPKSVE